MKSAPPPPEIPASLLSPEALVSESVRSDSATSDMRELRASYTSSVLKLTLVRLGTFRPTNEFDNLFKMVLFEVVEKVDLKDRVLCKEAYDRLRHVLTRLKNLLSQWNVGSRVVDEIYEIVYMDEPKDLAAWDKAFDNLLTQRMAKALLKTPLAAKGGPESISF